MDYSYDKTSPEALKASVLAELSGMADTREGSYLDTVLGPWALQAYKCAQMIPWIMELAFPGESSGEFIDLRAADFGLVRTPGVKATAQLQFTARAGAVPEIPEGTMVVTTDGLQFETTAAAVFVGQTALVPAQAVGIGQAYNVDAGSLIYMVKTIAGVESVTNPDDAAGGADAETDTSLLARYKAYMRKAIVTGNAAYYEDLALRVSGVGKAYCVPLWAGPGTARVVIAGPNKEALDSATMERARAQMETGRLIGCALTVDSVRELTVNVAATITLAADATADDVAADLTLRLSAWLQALPFGVSNLLRVSKVLSMLLDCSGVEEYSNITVNEGTANITADSDQTMVAGTVSLTVAAAQEETAT